MKLAVNDKNVHVECVYTCTLTYYLTYHPLTYLHIHIHMYTYMLIHIDTFTDRTHEYQPTQKN